MEVSMQMLSVDHNKKNEEVLIHFQPNAGQMLCD
jgi:hypothetical protein